MTDMQNTLVLNKISNMWELVKESLTNGQMGYKSYSICYMQGFKNTDSCQKTDRYCIIMFV